MQRLILNFRATVQALSHVGHSQVPPHPQELPQKHCTSHVQLVTCPALDDVDFSLLVFMISSGLELTRVYARGLRRA